MLTRRAFLPLLAMPAIIKVSALMPVSSRNVDGLGKYKSIIEVDEQGWTNIITQERDPRFIMMPVLIRGEGVIWGAHFKQDTIV
jgi:hypothetical protein